MDREGESYFVQLDVSKGLFELVAPSPDATFVGSITLEVQDLLGVFARGREAQALLLFRSEIEPKVDRVESVARVYAGQRIELAGDGFLRASEGVTWAVVTRGSVREDGGESRDVTGARARVLWAGSRTKAYLPAVPQIFGITPGTFEGELRFENELRNQAVFQGRSARELRTSLVKSRLDAVSPTQGSRGQIVRMIGQGFLETNSTQGYGMYLRYDGTFSPDAMPGLNIDYRGPRSIDRVPLRVVDAKTLEQEVWYDVDEETFTLTGLGALAGVFDGRITPVLVWGGAQQVGDSWRGQFRVLPTRQLVHLRFLPGFSESLQRFGLGNVESAVRDRIIQVLRRDYEGINIEFAETPPQDFVDSMTLEIGGPDPTGQNLLGYDNSFNGVPKDTGNLFLKDYLGGYNRDSQQAGFAPYGGVFIESFVIFSPTLSKDQGDPSPVFDRTLEPFMTELGGTPVASTEWPEGPRSAEILRAILMVANLAGHTASHEVGHSLGLPYVEGETPEDVVYHNDDEGKAYIMDAGFARPFKERANLDGEGPAVFSPTNRAYLERILPMR